jgi:hypothetical protein
MARDVLSLVPVSGRPGAPVVAVRRPEGAHSWSFE